MSSPTWGAPAPGEPDDGQRPPMRSADGGRRSARSALTAPDEVQRPDRRSEAPPGPERRVRVRVVERFPGQRVHHRTGPLRRIRSALALVVTAVVVGAALAAALSAIVWGISVAIHHATTS